MSPETGQAEAHFAEHLPSWPNCLSLEKTLQVNRQSMRVMFFHCLRANSAENSESLFDDVVMAFYDRAFWGKLREKKYAIFETVFDSFLMCKQSTPTHCQLALASTKTVAVS